jgi:NADH dehydrogenase
MRSTNVKKQSIVVLGAGFGGLAAAVTLARALRRDAQLALAYDVVLIDRNDDHVYTPGLYEAATTLRKHAEPLELKRAATVPIADVIAGLPVRFIQDEVTGIDAKALRLTLRDNGSMDAAYLLVALGSKATDFGIPGVWEYAAFLKTFEDALQLRRVLTEQLIDRRDARVLIVGGGAAGVEVAGEIVGFAKHLCARDGRLCNPGVRVIESGSRLIGELPGMGEAAFERLRRFGIYVDFGTKVTKVERDAVTVQQGEKTERWPYDLLIWTAGIAPQDVCHTADVPRDDRGRWLIGEDLRVEGHDRLYAIGDIARITNPAKGRPAPATAYVAIAQGRLAAKNILATLRGKKQGSYTTPARPPMIVPIGGRWAVARLGLATIKGGFAFLFRLAADLRYFFSILPLWRAMGFFANSVRVYIKND